MKRVLKLKKQNSAWKIVSEHSFKKRVYEVCKKGYFYRKGKKVNVKQDKVGSYTVMLTDDNGLKKRFKIHQIVAQTYLKEPLLDYHSVDHKNRIRTDNRVKNLRIADRKTQYKNRENSKHKLKPVICLNNGLEYNSCQEAENRLKLTKNTVSRVARGDRKSIHGFLFEYK